MTITCGRIAVPERAGHPHADLASDAKIAKLIGQFLFDASPRYSNNENISLQHALATEPSK